MNSALNICVCNNIDEEFKLLIERENIPDVIITEIPSKCIDKLYNAEKAADQINSKIPTHNSTVLIGCNQLCVLESKINKNRKFEAYPVGYCLEALIDKTLINYFSGRGYYIITNGWLNNYDYVLESWGFNKEAARDFFRETIKKFLLLDTGGSEINYDKIKELTEYLKLPVEVLQISPDHLRGFLLKIILEWRLKNEKNLTNVSFAKLTKQSADYAMIFDFIVPLVEIENEEEIINKIFEVINMLCAPRDIYFIAVKDGIKMDVLHKGETPLQYSNSDEFLSNYELNNADSFLMDIVHLNDKVGILIINAVYFPEHIRHYGNMIKTLSFVFGLAITNARKIAMLKNNEETIRKYSDDLALSNLNKDKFFSIIAHDLKSPFHGFLGLTEMLSEDISAMSSEEIARLSKEMHKSAYNLFRLLENLLTWARMQKGAVSFSVEELNLRRLAAGSIETIKDAAVQKGIIITNLIHDTYMVNADAEMISSVFRNLISNSVKFSRRGGSVLLTAKETRGNMIEVSVADNGIGMTEILVDKLFKLSEKVGRKGTEGEDSTGLGLLLCKEFVEKNGGAIWVQSVVNVGTTFNFTLPKT